MAFQPQDILYAWSVLIEQKYIKWHHSNTLRQSTLMIHCIEQSVAKNLVDRKLHVFLLNGKTFRWQKSTEEREKLFRLAKFNRLFFCSTLFSAILNNILTFFNIFNSFSMEMGYSFISVELQGWMYDLWWQLPQFAQKLFKNPTHLRNTQ